MRKFLATLFYAVHPIHTEAVTYIASRGDLLSALLTLSAILLYWRGQWKAVLPIYGLALFSKESSILLPAYLLVLDFCFIKTSKRKLIFKMLSFFAVALLYILYRQYRAHNGDQINSR